MKSIYFICDAHLGSLAVPHRRQQERRLVRFLDEIKDKAGAIYMLGDMFDFWFEYQTVVPKGFTRFLGWKFKLIRGIFHNKFCQWMFRWLHPALGMPFGLNWAKHSRMKHESSLNGNGGDPPYQGEDKEPLVIFAKQYLKEHPEVDYFIFGHRHIELDLAISHQTRVLILGDWISQFTYAVYDGEQLYLERYTEGEPHK